MNPFAVDADGQPLANEDQIELATLGGLLMNELVADSRGMVDKPMMIQFLPSGPTVVPFKVEGPDADVKVQAGAPRQGENG